MNTVFQKASSPGFSDQIQAELNKQLLEESLQANPLKVRELLSRGAYANAKDKNERSALMHAGSSHVALYLIAMGASVHAKDYLDQTALMFASERGLQGVADTLIHNGADVNMKSKSEMTALMYATICGHLGTAELLIRYGADVNATDSDGMTALMRASACDTTVLDAKRNDQAKSSTVSDTPSSELLSKMRSIAALLVFNGAIVNARDVYGRSVLMLAANHEMAVQLIASGASVHASDTLEREALMNASRDGKNSLVSVLLISGANVNAVDSEGVSALIDSVKRGFLETSDLLTANGADVNLKDKDDRTALYHAIQNKFLGIAMLLIVRGAAVNATIKGTPLLIFPVISSSQDFTSLLLKNGADVNAKGAHGQTALGYATDGAIVNLLLSHGALDDAADRDGVTALMLSALRGNCDIAAQLIEHGADIHLKSSFSMTAMDFAVVSGHREIAALLINHGVALNHKDANGTTLLMRAAAGELGTLLQTMGGVNYIRHIYKAVRGEMKMIGCSAQISFLIASGARVNASDNRGRSVLMYAAEHGTMQTAALLIKHGASVAAKDHQQVSLLMIAAMRGSRMASCFLKHSSAPKIDDKDASGMTALMHAAKNGHIEVSSLLLEENCDIHARDNEGRCALHYAAEQSRNLVQLLLTKGSDVNAEDYLGKSVLMVSVASLKVQSAISNTALLIEAGALVNAANSDGCTVLMFAAKSVVAALIISKGAEINARDAQGRTPLIRVVARRDLAIAALLVANGACVHAADSDGDTALILSTHFAITKLLVDNGANVNAKNNRGATALMTVPSSPDIVALLIDNRADVNVVDDEGGTPLMHAAIYDQDDVCSVLVLHGADPAATDNRNETALQMYGRKYDQFGTNLYNGPWQFAPMNHFFGDDDEDEDFFDDDLWSLGRAPLFPEEKQAAVDAIVAARAKYLAALLEFKRQAAWNRRKALLGVVTSHGLRPLAARAAAEAVLQPEIDPSAPIPPVPRGTAEENKAYLLGQVLTHETIFKSIVSYM